MWYPKDQRKQNLFWKGLIDVITLLLMMGALMPQASARDMDAFADYAQMPQAKPVEYIRQKAVPVRKITPVPTSKELEFRRQREEYNARMERRRKSRLGDGRPSKGSGDSGLFDWFGE